MQRVDYKQLLKEKTTITMLMSRCCCCFNLKYGYFAYGILSMATRLMAYFSLYYTSHIIFYNTNGDLDDQILMSRAMTIYSGWVITGIASLFFTLKGIVEKRSILIYPHIVVLSVELFSVIILSIILSMVATPYYLIILPFGGGFVAYELLCLINLYKQMKDNEQVQYLREAVPFKAI